MVTKPWYKNKPTKKFGGKVYARFAVHYSKTEAKDRAKDYRKQGYLARLSPVYDMVSHFGTDGRPRRTMFWGVWVRKIRG